MAAALVSTSTSFTSCELKSEKTLRQSTASTSQCASIRAPRKASALLVARASQSGENEAVVNVGRREAAAAGATALFWSLAAPEIALADFVEDYKKETSDVIEKVRETLKLDKSDPKKGDSVSSLREASNVWVAKYRREKAVAGKPSFSNMYSALNAISGHYISFGAGYPFPKKRAERILEEVSDAERQLARGR